MFFGKLKVLVAEDSKLQRAMLVTILKARKEYMVLEAEDGLEAQKLVPPRPELEFRLNDHSFATLCENGYIPVPTFAQIANPASGR